MKRPTNIEISNLNHLIPVQPKMLAGVFMGDKNQSGWWPNSQKYSWHDPIEMVVELCTEFGIEVSLTNAKHAPFHPGRCAEISINKKIIGYAGEFHPGVVEKSGLSGKVYGFEICMDDIIENAIDQMAPTFSAMPVVKEDLAFVVGKDAMALDLITTIQRTAGSLLESVRLFDVYEGSSIGQNKKSMAFNLRFRATDRTLTSDEVSKIRLQIVEAVAKEHSGSLRA